jgi:hypothetical protein
MACGAGGGFAPRVELLQGLAQPLPNNQHSLEVFALQVSQLMLRPLVSRLRARQQRQQQQDGGSTVIAGQWELVCKLAPKVPQEVAAVLEHLHCSRELALWQALTQPIPAEDTDRMLWNLVTAFTRLQLGADDTPLAHIAGPQQPQELLMLLLSLALVWWTSSRPWDTAKDVEAHQRVCWLTNNACTDFSLRQRQQGEQEQRQGATTRALLPPGVQRSLQQHMGVLGPRMLQLRRLQLAALAAGNSGSSGGSSGGSISGGSIGSDEFTDAAGQRLMLSAFQQTARLTVLLADLAVDQALSAMGPQGSSSAGAGLVMLPSLTPGVLGTCVVSWRIS